MIKVGVGKGLPAGRSRLSLPGQPLGHIKLGRHPQAAKGNTIIHSRSFLRLLKNYWNHWKSRKAGSDFIHTIKPTKMEI